jgi:hypothetical protein
MNNDKGVMMAVTVEKLPDEPIIIVTSVGQINVTMMREVYAQIAAILDKFEPPLYRITDARNQETSFADMIGIIKEASKGMPGTTTDPRIRNVFVGRDKFAMLARQAYVNTGSTIPLFDTLEDALTHIRYELSKQDGSDPPPAP